MSRFRLMLPALAMFTAMAPLAANARWVDDHNHHQKQYLVQSSASKVAFSTGRSAERLQPGQMDPAGSNLHYAMLRSTAGGSSDTNVN